MGTRNIFPAALGLALLACSCLERIGEDAAAPDGGPPLSDASTFDAFVFDSGRPDAGTPDASTPDASTPDASTPDAGRADGAPRDSSGADACDYIIDAGQSINTYSDIAGPGQTVCIHAGVYRETLEPGVSGRPGSMITFKAYPGEECTGEYGGIKQDCRVVIDGSQVIGGAWQPHSGTIYSTPLPAGIATGFDNWQSVDSVFDNGERLRFATEPDQPTPYFNFARYYRAEAVTSTSVQDSRHLTQPDGFWTGGWVKFRDVTSAKKPQRDHWLLLPHVVRGCDRSQPG